MSTVLITGAGGPAGRSLVRQLRAYEQGAGETEFVLIGTDMTDVEVDGLTMHIRIPPANSPEFLPVLAGLAAFVDADLLIPTVSEELPLISAAAALIGADLSTVAPMVAASDYVRRSTMVTARTAVVISDSESVGLAGDKLLTMWALRDAGVAIPAFASAGAVSSASEAVALLGGPVIRKPRVSRGARGVTLITADGVEDLSWAPVNDFLLQRFAPGAEFCAQVFRSPLSREIRVVVVLRKTQLSRGDVGNAVSVVRDDSRPDVGALAAAAVAALDITGPADVDIRLDAEGKPVVLEVNARFGAQSASAPEVLQATLNDYLVA